jgi:porin
MKPNAPHVAPLIAATLIAAVLSVVPSTVKAQQPGQSAPNSIAPGQNAVPNPNPGPGSPGGAPGLFGQTNLLGTMFGLRPYLASKGISYGISETSEVLGNVTGGVHRGADYDGLTTLSVGLDAGKALGWSGATFNVSALEIHGRNLSADNLYTIQTASGIEANRTFRLWELWFDQATRDGKTDIKIGQQSVDQEFLTSTYTTLFINTVMGWPGVPSYDLYASGPAYPLSSLGVRLRAVRGPFTGLLGVFDDNPPGGPVNDDSQTRGAERTGTAFNLNTGALVIGEVQYAVGAAGNGVGGKAGPLPGTYRVGGWFDSGQFPDQRFDAQGDGLDDSLANPNAGPPKLRRDNFAAYFSGDQQVWIDHAGIRSVGVFTRLIGAPDDRNFLSLSANGGVILKAPLLARPNDTVGVGLGVAKISGRASALNQDVRIITRDPAYPIRSSETFVELTYQAQIAPWWQVQPDFQYVWTPGGGVPDPANPDGASTPRIGNEAVLGVRTNITF